MISAADRLGNYVLALAGFYLVGLLLVVVIAKIFSLVTLSLVQKRWRSRRTIIAEYEPPLGLLPEELGYVFDRAYSDNELASVLVQLVQDDLLSVRLHDGDWHFRRTAKPTEAQHSSPELIVLGEFGLHPDNSLTWRQLSSTNSETVGVQAAAEAAITNSLIDKGLVSAEGYGRLSGLKNSTALLIGLGLSIATLWLPLATIHRLSQTNGLVSEYQNLDEFMTILFLLPAFALSVMLLYWYSKLVVYIYYRGSGLPVGATPKLRAAWPEVIGYRQFLKTVEFGRLHTAGTLDDPVLPYCVALGLDMKAIHLHHSPRHQTKH